MKQTHTTTQSLEYIALLSGLSMAGTDVSDKDIEITRQNHTRKSDRFFSFVSLANAVKR